MSYRVHELRLSTKVLVFDSTRIDFVPGIYIPVNFDSNDAHLFPGVALDATTRFQITPTYSLIVGNRLVPLSLGRRASLNLNYSLIIQGNPSWGARLSSQLFHIRLNGDVRQSSFSSTPIALTWFYSFGNRIDLSATYSNPHRDAKLLYFSIAHRQ